MSVCCLVLLSLCYTTAIFAPGTKGKKNSSVLGFGTLTSSCTKGKRQDSIFGQLPAWNSSLYLISPHKDVKGNATMFTNWCWGPPGMGLGKHQTPELQRINHHHPVLIFSTNHMTPSELGWSRGGKQANDCWKRLAGDSARYSDWRLLSHTLGEKTNEHYLKEAATCTSKNKNMHSLLIRYFHFLKYIVEIIIHTNV